MSLARTTLSQDCAAAFQGAAPVVLSNMGNWPDTEFALKQSRPTLWCLSPDLRKLLMTTPVRRSKSLPNVPPRQRQRRLRPDEVKQLKAHYLSGIEVRELAAQ
jgi:hypothetical protein